MSKTNRAKAAKEARRLLEKVSVNEAPVPVERIARELKIDVRYSPIEDDVSGFLYRKGETVIIGINANHHANRQRFTLAHELGHFVLHDREIFHDADVHVDQDAGRARFRDETSSQATDPAEIEANAFAAELLMPKALIQHDVSPSSGSLDDEKFIAALAQRYKVSVLAMTIRLTNLGIIGDA